MSKLLAHSQKQGIPAQTYLEHITNVHRRAIQYANDAVAFYTGERDSFVNWVEAAAVYHDLGKLDSANQEVLQKNSHEGLRIAHEDAGVAELDKLGRNEAFVLIHAHHAGLFSREKELATQGRPFRQLERTTPNGELVAEHVDRELENYERIHTAAGCPALDRIEPTALHGCGFTRRIALSCLVDADHGDTAHNYRNEVEIPKIQPRWNERLEALQRYVDLLPQGDTEPERNRNKLRSRLFEACRDAGPEPRIRTCDAPVGTGKTTAVMAHLLGVAAKREPQLRHIIVVLPYTNIITQSVKVYREALALEGERSEDVVAEHHHRAEFGSVELRQLSTLWKAPIIVTTAVQFFETLGSHHPASLRKLHELPGSAVFVDEMHAAIPSHLWPQMWRWLQTWTRDWGGHLVLASGSLPRFWKLNEYKELMLPEAQTFVPELPDLVTDESLRNELKNTEEKRITYARQPEDVAALDCEGVISFVREKEKTGPRLLIANTVQTAAVIAQKMREKGYDVLHLSTALAPIHRDVIVERIKQRLKYKVEDWTLVATSCVESGMDFSFRAGFRERASTASLIQIGGRVSRGDEFTDAEVWDILLQDKKFRSNPSLTVSRQALDRFKMEELNLLHPAELATLAMRREWTAGAEEKAKDLIKHEEGMEYPTVSKDCQVIAADTRTVIIDRSIAVDIENHRKVSRLELIRHSVQIWATKINKLGLKSLILKGNQSDTGLYLWPYDYDPDFLGYMQGVMKLEEYNAAGGAVI